MAWNGLIKKFNPKNFNIHGNIHDTYDTYDTWHLEISQDFWVNKFFKLRQNFIKKCDKETFYVSTRKVRISSKKIRLKF